MFGFFFNICLLLNGLKCKSRNENAYIARKTEFRLCCRFLLLKNRQLLLSDFSFYRIEREEMSKL